MFQRIVLLFVFSLISGVAAAQIQGVEVVGTINLDYLLPPPPSGKTIRLNLVLNEGDLTPEQIDRLKQLKALGYQLAIQFPGPDKGFSTTQELLSTADSIRKVLPAIGTNYAACVIGHPDHPLSQNILDRTVDLSFAMKSMALACRSGNPRAEVYLGMLNSDLFEAFSGLLSTQSLNAYIDGYLTAATDFKNFQSLLREKQPSAV